jgi:hypothetical protein
MSCPAIPQAWWPLAHLIRDPFALPAARTAMLELWLVTLARGCAYPRRLIGCEMLLILDHCPQSGR